MKITCECANCGKSITVRMPQKAYDENFRIALNCTCNDCVPKNSPARDGIHESIYTEIEPHWFTTFMKSFKKKIRRNRL